MYKILVVDDEEILRERLKKLLTLDDFDVVVAEDGVFGIEVFKAERPHVAIVDIKMPRMDGVELLKHLKQLSEDVEVIMVTGHASIETALEALKLGAFDYIGKPVNYDELKLVVDRAIENRELKVKLRQQEAHRDFFEKQMLFQLQSNLNLTKTLVQEQLSLLPDGESLGGFRELIERIDAMFQLHGLLDPKNEAKETDMQNYLQTLGHQLRQIFGVDGPQLEVVADSVLLANFQAIACGWIVRSILTCGFNGNSSSPLVLPAAVNFAKKSDAGHELKISVKCPQKDPEIKVPNDGMADIDKSIVALVSTCLEGVLVSNESNGRWDFTITFPDVR